MEEVVRIPTSLTEQSLDIIDVWASRLLSDVQQ